MHEETPEVERPDHQPAPAGGPSTDATPPADVVEPKALESGAPDAPASGADGPEVVNTAFTPSRPAPPSQHWREGTWHGRSSYICRYCRYTTLHEGDIRRHVANHLAPMRPTTLMDLVDQHGNPLTRRS